MKVILSCISRFHMFNQVQELQKYEAVHSFISTYPGFSLSSSRFAHYGLEKNLYVSLWKLGLMYQSALKINSKIYQIPRLRDYFFDKFDRANIKYISSDADIFHGWSSMCLLSLKQAKNMRLTTLLERCSSHTKFSENIFSEEYRRWGIEYKKISPYLYERELQEYEESDYIIVPSLFAKRTFLKQGFPENKIVYVPLGVSLDEFYPIPKKDEVFRIIYCGGINYRKGIQYLLQAFKELNLPNTELWLVGYVAREFKPLLEKYESDNIIFKGYYPQTQLKFLYSQCSVFCLPSLSDGFGMVITQAMACGLPVIYTPNTGGPDVARDGVDGFCIGIRDTEALKEKILFLYENPDSQQEMSINARNQVKNFSNWETYGKNLLNAYQSILPK